MAVSQHDSNRTDAADLFINDFSSKNDVQQKLKKREDEAAELKRKEAAAKQAEADRRVKEAAITKQLEELKQENGQLVTKKKELEANVKSGIEREQQLTAQRDQANQKASLLQAAADERERMKPNPDNDLPADFHGKLVTFINSGSKTAVDMGDASGTRMHGWGQNLGNSWQHLLLEKVNPGDHKSPWLVTNSMSGCKRYLELRSDEDSSRPTCSPREGHSDSQKFQEWLIGSNGPGKWMLQNARWGKWLDLTDTTQYRDGGQYRPCRQIRGWASQNFYLVCF